MVGNVIHQPGRGILKSLPEKGKSFKKDEVFGTVESVKSVSELISPVSCEIIEFNEMLSEKPESLNKSPYDDSWLIKVKLKDPSEIESLLNKEEYRKLTD